VGGSRTVRLTEQAFSRVALHAAEYLMVRFAPNLATTRATSAATLS
jgi:hypothetical protein